MRDLSKFIVGAKKEVMILHEKLYTAKSKNEKKDGYRAELNKAHEKLLGLNKEFDYHKVIYEATLEERRLYKEERLEEFENDLNKAIELFFPGQDIRCSVSLSGERNKEVAYLYTKGKNGKLKSPKVAEGKYLQQLIGIVSTFFLSSNLGGKVMFLDEAASSADGINIERLHLILDTLIEKYNTLVIMIEQRPSAYDKVKRKEFHLSKDITTEIARIEEVKEFG